MPEIHSLKAANAKTYVLTAAKKARDYYDRTMTSKTEGSEYVKVRF